MEIFEYILRWFDLILLKFKKQRIWHADIQYRRLRTKKDVINEDALRYASDNTEIDYGYCERSAFIFYLTRWWPIAVACVDVLVGFVAISVLTSHISGHPLLVTSLTAVLICFIEIMLGLLKMKMANEREQEFHAYLVADGFWGWWNSIDWNKVKKWVTVFMASIMLVVIPFISVSEYFVQTAVYDTQLQMAYITPEGWQMAIRSLRIKFSALIILYLTTHWFVLFRTDRIVSAFGELRFRRGKQYLKSRMEAIQLRQTTLEGRIDQVLVDYIEKQEAHIYRFGSAHLSRPRFSPYILQRYYQLV